MPIAALFGIDNDDHLKELSTELNNQIPFYGLQFTVWNSINPDITKILKEFTLMKDIAIFYYYLQVLERMLNSYFINWIIEKNPKHLKTELAAKMMVRINWILRGEKCKSPQTLMSEIDCLIKRY